MKISAHRRPLGAFVNLSETITKKKKKAYRFGLTTTSFRTLAIFFHLSIDIT